MVPWLQPAPLPTVKIAAAALPENTIRQSSV
jgi:hypothetical protein